MRFDFSDLCALRDTLGHLMERYEENENAFRQFYDAVAEKTLCPHSIGPIRIYDGRDAVLEYIRCSAIPISATFSRQNNPFAPVS